MKRRQILMAPAALAASAIAPAFAAIPHQMGAPSEILELYARWREAIAEIERESERRGYGDETRIEKAAQIRSERLRGQLATCEPKTMPEIAAMLHVLWDALGYQPDEGDTFWNAGSPSILASIWRGASGQEGTPQH